MDQPVKGLDEEDDDDKFVPSSIDQPATAVSEPPSVADRPVVVEPLLVEPSSVAVEPSSVAVEPSSVVADSKQMYEPISLTAANDRSLSSDPSFEPPSFESPAAADVDQHVAAARRILAVPSSTDDRKHIGTDANPSYVDAKRSYTDAKTADDDGRNSLPSNFWIRFGLASAAGLALVIVVGRALIGRASRPSGCHF